jgi:hypothetical protein
MIKTIIGKILSEAARKDKKCPPATQDVSLNLKNRQSAIKKYGYGPADPFAPAKENKDFWDEKVEMWGVKSQSQLKRMKCGTCAAFDTTPFMKSCMSKGLDDSQTDDYDTVSAGDLGYCHMFKFKCASARTCDAWVGDSDKSKA